MFLNDPQPPNQRLLAGLLAETAEHGEDVRLILPRESENDDAGEVGRVSGPFQVSPNAARRPATSGGKSSSMMVHRMSRSTSS